MNHRELIAALTPLHGAGEARAIVRMVMEERFGLSQIDLLLGKDTDLSANDRTELEKIAERLLVGEPVQHVLGYAYFCGRRFRVTPDVLIPRPETEDLVAWATDELRLMNDEYSEQSSINGHQSSIINHQSSIEILDLCTGSGCVAITLALAFPDAHVVGVDISPAALAIARENATTLGAHNVTFIECDILSDPSSLIVPLGGPQGAFHLSSLIPQPSPLGDHRGLLISNPPYVRTSEAADIHPTVLHHEPSLALFVPDDDPLRFYRAIARIGQQLLPPAAPVFVEINAALAPETRHLFTAAGYSDVQLRDDQFSRPRMLKAMRSY